MIIQKLLTRAGIAASVVGHLAFVAWLLLAGSRHFEPGAQAMAVDLVTPDEIPQPKEKDPWLDLPKITAGPESTSDADAQSQAEAEKTSEQSSLQKPEPPAEPAIAKPDPKPPTEKLAAAQPAEPQSPPPQQQPLPSQPMERQPEQQPAIPVAQPDITSKFGMSFTMPNGGATGDFDAKATAQANIKVQDAAALRAHLKSCSVLPKSVSPADNVRIVLRVAFQQDGRLAREPMLIEASASAKGPALMQSAMQALEKCQPYAMLPADRYNEWRMLDLSFTPKDFRS